MRRRQSSSDKPKTKRTAMAVACWYLGRREYSQKELKDVLTRHEYPQEEIELTLRKLSEQGWQSDTRAVNMMVLSESYRRHGPARIKAKARNKGLGELVEQALEQSQIDWEQQAKEAVERKFGPGPFERALQVKVAQFLLRKGYPIDVAWKMARLEPDDGHIPDGCD